MAGTELPEIGDMQRDGLNVIVRAPLGVQAARSALELTLTESGTMHEAATVTDDGNAVTVSFKRFDPPPHFVKTAGETASRHQVACWLFEDELPMAQ